MNTKKILAIALPVLATTGLVLWVNPNAYAQDLETIDTQKLCYEK